MGNRIMGGIYGRGRKPHKIIGGIESKHCPDCDNWNPLTSFRGNKKFWDGLHTYCRVCAKTRDARKHSKRRDAVSIRNKEYYQENKNYILQRNKSYVEKNKNDVNQYKSDWQKENGERRRIRLNERYRTEPNFKIAVNLRTRILNALKNNQKVGTTLDLLGCSVDFFREYLGSMFREGMSWDNHGTVWHIDHKKPCASFDLSDPEQQKQCFHHTNMQPLYWQDNLKKGDRYYE